MDIGSLLGYDNTLSNKLTNDKNLPHTIQRPCICQPLHNVCDPTLCTVAARAPFLRHTPLSWPPPPPVPASEPQWAVTTSVKNLMDAANRGCPTCTVIYDALYSPGIYLKWDPNRSNHYSIVKIKGRNGELQVGDLGLDLISTNYQETTGCKAFALSPRLSETTSSEESYSSINCWIQECFEDHKDCDKISNTNLPTRILVIKNDLGKHPQIRLLETANVQAPYAALSYCWGGQKFITTTRETLHLRKKGIDWNQFPKSFQDAINITRRLKIQYLWIDSLCILQDDPTDWATESAKMGSIYEHAYLTIAASYAENVHGGCFALTREAGGSTLNSVPLRDDNNRPVYDDRPDKIPSGISVRSRLDHNKFRDRPSLFHGIPIDKCLEPLSRRGWCLQERLLSRRIVHYTASELVWECGSTMHCQCDRIAHIEESLKLSLNQSLKKCFDSPNLSAQWIRVVEEYSERYLTVESDRLPALSGLAKQFQSAGAGTYLAGLWSENLLQLLHWRVDSGSELDPGSQQPKRNKNKYLAPSWSWVSINGRINFPCRDEVSGKTKRQPAVRLLDAKCTPATADHTGSILAGYIKVAGYVVKTFICNNNEYEAWDIVLANKNMRRSFSPDVRLIKDNAPMVQRRPVSCILWSVPYGEGEFEPDGDTVAYFMVLEKSTGIDDAYERLGIGYLSWEAIGPVFDKGIVTARAWFANAPEAVITIV